MRNLLAMKNNEIPEKWKKVGIAEPQQLIDAINEAFSNKEKLIQIFI